MPDRKEIVTGETQTYRSDAPTPLLDKALLDVFDPEGRRVGHLEIELAPPAGSFGGLWQISMNLSDDLFGDVENLNFFGGLRGLSRTRELTLKFRTKSWRFIVDPPSEGEDEFGEVE